MSVAQTFADQHILVTGAGSGIGRAIALRLAAHGARLTLVARRIEPLRVTAERCGGAALVRGADIRDRASVEAAFDAACERHGPLFALVAGSGIGGPNKDGATDRFEDLVATNLTGTYFCLRAAQGRLAPGPGARHLLVISSVLARLGVPGYSGYCASKAGLLGLVRSFAAELAERDVQVNALLPGWVETDMAKDGLADMAREGGISPAEARARALSAVPLRRMSTPEEIAGVVAWLLSPDGRGLTGACLDVNNGAVMS